MKCWLMYRERDFELRYVGLARGRDFEFERTRNLPANRAALVQDLELETLFDAMAGGDGFLFEAARSAVLLGAEDGVETIRYRQEILKDCLRNRETVRAIYALALEAVARERKHYFGVFGNSPGTTLHRAVEILQMFVEMLKRLRGIGRAEAAKFSSQGFVRFFAMLERELGDDYFAAIEGQLKELKFRQGVLMSAELGKGGVGQNYVLREPRERDRDWLAWLLAPKVRSYTLQIHPRDQAGGRALMELRDRGINLVANALAQSADHILSFFRMLQTELAFYIGGVNLQEKLAEIDAPTAFPVPAAPGERRFSATELYDVCLALTVNRRVVGNDVNADHKDLVVITGANQGGKSTFLRSAGLAQLMMQCGLFVAAEAFSSTVCDGLFTHYKREEDEAMRSGKFDEELGRMSEIVDHLTPRSMVLCNESFAATNVREGSEIGTQIVTALLESGIRVFFVTHLYEFAHGFHQKNTGDVLFLRADRREDGVRTFKLKEAEPLDTSFGEDLYKRIFLADAANRASHAAAAGRRPLFETSAATAVDEGADGH
jgi:DNA mismatch repair ATPase MutS